MFHPQEIEKYGSRFRSTLEGLVDKLKYLIIRREDEHFIIRDAEKGILNEVWATDIVSYIFCYELSKEGNVYAEIIDWCYERMSKNDALIFDPHSCR